MKMRKVLAGVSALCVAAGAFSALCFSADAADEIAQAYFIGGLGADTSWNAEDFGSPTSVTGDGTYEVEWNLTGGGTDTVQFLAVCIAPTGVDNFTTDTFENLEVSLDEVWIDGVQLTDYTVSDNAINTAYYEDGAGVTRIYLHDEWAGTKVSDLPSATDVTQSVKVVFTVSGTASGAEETDETEPDTDPITPEYQHGTVGDAYFIGGLGGDTSWNLEDFQANSTPTPINGSGTYSLQWDLAAGGTDTVQFLAVCIAPTGVDNFTTDTLENLEVTLDEVWIDGVQLMDYTVSDNAINTAYYEDGAGVTRIYLHDDWTGTKVSDLPSATDITQNIRVVFTVSGADIEPSGLLGDVDQNGVVDATDASEILIAAAKIGAGQGDSVDPAVITLGDVNSVDGLDATDASIILQYAAACGVGYTGTIQDFLAQ